MKKYLFLILITSVSLTSFAQNKRKVRQEEKKSRINAMIRQEEEGVIVYKKSFIVGGKLSSDGYGAFFELGRASSVKNSMLYQLEFSEKKHVKENKQSSIFSNSIPFIYGKRNFFYPVKLGVQRQVLLGNKSNKNGVSITGNYGGGVIAGLLRPYYVQIEKGNELVYVKFDSPDSAAFLQSQVFAGPSFGKGWSELSVTPGLYAKLGLRFDYGAFNEVVSAIEVGLTGEYYSKKIPQLVFNEEKQFFFGAYFALLFGKRK